MRKGQLYILTVVILLGAVSLFTLNYKTPDNDNNFEKLYLNFILEYPKSVNSGGTDFIDKFIDYAHQQDSGFGVLTVVVDSNATILIVNRLGFDVLAENSTISDGSSVRMDYSDSIAIYADGITYNFNLSMPDIEELFISKGSDYKKVFISQ